MYDQHELYVDRIARRGGKRPMMELTYAMGVIRYHNDVRYKCPVDAEQSRSEIRLDKLDSLYAAQASVAAHFHE